MEIAQDIADLLEEESRRINRPEFIESDPVQFPRRFSDQRDVEIAALLASAIAWGNRKMICRDGDRLMALMDNEPYKYMMDQGYEDLNPDLNIHRTFFGRNLQYFLRGLREIYRSYPTLDYFAASKCISNSEAPAWALAEAINIHLREANHGATDSRALPQNLKNTALKRLNMALRWLVRDDGIVDMGLWKSIPKSKLFLPMDVHVGDTSRQLGLLKRKSNDRKAVEELTLNLRTLDCSDPCKFDYALFGIGMQL